jgi:polar amino acid transport system substrate-binding protein
MYYFLFALQITVLFLISSTVTAQTQVQLYYGERVPYAMTDEHGAVHGLTATAAAKAFEQAGIPFQWKKMPFKRQLATIKANKKMACGIGWFKKPEREKFARFTEVIYQDRPSIVISKKDSNAIAQYGDVSGLLQDKTVKLLVKDSFSYGAYVDEQIIKYQPETVVVVGSDNSQMLQMVLSGRVDYFFAAEEEAEEVIVSAGYSMSEFQLHHFTDMLAGNSRYIACSQQVTPETIDLLNQALE